MMKGKIRTSESGITLIALVITIILLVILATIGINAVFGEDGLIARAEKAGESHDKVQELERLEIVKGEVAIESAQDGNGGRYTVEDYVNKLVSKGIAVEVPTPGTGEDSQTVVTDKEWLINISQDGLRNVVFDISKYTGTIPMRITKIEVTPSLKNMTLEVKVTAVKAEGAIYKYYYKKDDGVDTYKLVHTGTETSYTITGQETGATSLIVDQVYTIKVETEKGTGASKETSALTQNAKIMSVPAGSGAIGFENPEWSNGKYSVKVTKKVSENYTIKYGKNLPEGTDYSTVGTEINSGEAIGNLEHGDEITVWLIDEDGIPGTPANHVVTDGTDPEEAEIGTYKIGANNVTEAKAGDEVKVTVKLEDKQSGIDLANSRWVITTSNATIGTTDSVVPTGYQVGTANETYGTFEGATQTSGKGGTEVTKDITITMPSVTNNTQYYLHILSTDKAGKKKETVSTQSITVKAPVSVTSLGLKIVEKNGTELETPIELTNEEEVTVKKNGTIKLDVVYNPGGTAPDDSLTGVTWSITSGVTSYVTLNTTTAPGLITGVNTIPSGTTVTVTATSTSNTSINATCKIVVSTASLDFSWTELEEIAKAISATPDSGEGSIAINTEGPIVYNNSTKTATIGTIAGVGEKILEIGDTTYVRFKDDGAEESTNHLVRIVGFKHDLLAEDGYNTGYTPIPFSSAGTKKYAGITFEFVNFITPTYAEMNATNVNTWTTSDMRETVLPGFISKIEDSTYGQTDLKMKKVYKETWSKGNGSYEENPERELWLFSEIEVFGTTVYSNTTNGNYEGTRYPFYTIGGSTLKYPSETAVNPWCWWLRSPRAGYEIDYCYVVNSGGLNFVTSKNKWGVVPGFAI